MHAALFGMQKQAKFEWVRFPLAIYGSNIEAYDKLLRLQFLIDDKGDAQIKKVPIYRVNVKKNHWRVLSTKSASFVQSVGQQILFFLECVLSAERFQNLNCSNITCL